MVTYCIGSARQKRSYFAEAGGAIVLDNVEVLFCASDNAHNFFAYGDVPFGSFSVLEYLCYRRALLPDCGVQSLLSALDSFGIARSKLIRRLSPVQMRCVAFLERAVGKTEKTLVVNLDGARYTKKDGALLKKLVALAPDAYVCVTDNRYIENADRGYKLLTFGKKLSDTKPDFSAAKRLARTVKARRVRLTAQ